MDEEDLETALELIAKAEEGCGWKESRHGFYTSFFDVKDSMFIHLSLRPADSQPNRDHYTLEINASARLTDVPVFVAAYTHERFTPVYQRILRSLPRRETFGTEWPLVIQSP